MPDRRADGVFISSVYDELKDYRRAALDAVWRCNLWPLGMEREDIAKPLTTSNASRALLEEAAVYVGIFSFRYGVVTAEEFEYAEARKLPILIFLADSPLNDDDQDLDLARQDKLEALKARARQHHTVASFRTSEELAIKVQRSLLELVGQGILVSGAANRDTIPRPPTPYFAHPYVAGSSSFVGRQAELGLLDAWASGPEPLLIIDAIGGTGKSALAWAWIQAHISRVFPQRIGIVWWSFYESNATMTGLFARALAYLNRHPLEDSAQLSRGEQEERLLLLLTQKPVVLILDGIERLLLAYHRLDAPHLTDDAVAAASRACIDPRDATFLRALSRATSSKILITSRLIPQALQDRTGQLLEGVRLLELTGLSARDALALFTQAGIRGNLEMIRAFLAQFGDHALLIQAMAGRIRDYRAAPGNFDAWYQAVGRTLKVEDQDLKGRQASILQASLADLDPLVFRLLCRLAAFRYPIDYGAVVTFNPFHADTNLEDALVPLHAALGTLEDRGLLQWDRLHNRYDMHPVVRAYAYAHLEDKVTTLSQMRDYFQALPTENTARANNVADLRHTLELYYSLLEGGQLDDAFALYASLVTTLRENLGAYTTIVQLLSPLFPHGFDKPPALQGPLKRANAATDLGLAFFNLGDQVQAQRLSSVALGESFSAGSSHNTTIDLTNLGISLLESRQLSTAERAYQLGLMLAQAVKNPEGCDLVYRYLVGLYAITHNLDRGVAAYQALQASTGTIEKLAPFTFLRGAQLTWSRGRNPDSLLAQALSVARGNRYLYAERETQTFAGEVAFAKSNFARAHEAWQEAYIIAQREEIPLGRFLADMARLYAVQHHEREAKATLTEALALGGFGVALAAVEVYLAFGEVAEARQYVDAAYREAWADGPPYSVYYELQRIRAALQLLRMPEPQLPLFNPGQILPLPEEPRILEYIATLQRGNAKITDE